MYSNRTRMVGLSGIDTVALVDQLMKAESFRYVNLQKQHQILLWQQEKYRSVAKSLQNFSLSYLSSSSPTSIRMEGRFSSFKAAVLVNGEDSKLATVRATSSAQQGSYTLEVSQLASKATATSNDAAFAGKLYAGWDADLNNLNTGDTVKFSLNGVTKEITIDKTGDGLVKNLENSLNAAYSRNDITVAYDIRSGFEGRLTFKVGNGGHDLAIYSGERAAGTVTSLTGADWLDGEGAPGKIDADGTYVFKVNNIDVSVDLKEDYGIWQVAAAINKAISEHSSADVKNSGVSATVSGNKLVFNNNNGLSESATVAAGTGSDLLGLMGVTGGTMQSTNTVGALGFSNGNSITNLTTSRTLEELFGSGYFNSGDTKNISVFNGKGDISISKTETISDFMKKINNTESYGVNVSYDSISGTFKMEAKNEGVANGFNWSDISSDMSALFGATGDFKAATNAVFTINGVTTDRDSNNFVIDGLEITLNKAEPGTEMTINVSKDSSGILDLVKSFVAAYNSIVDEINGEVSATRPRNGKYSYYEPLTDDEKKAMSEREIDLWEAKAKEGLLARDSILSGILSDMRMAMMTDVVVDGTRMNLFHCGVTTSDFFEGNGGKLYIDEEKLSEAIDKHGDNFIKLFTQGDDSVRGYKSETIGLGERLNRIIEGEFYTIDGVADRDRISGAIGINGSLTKKAGVDHRAMSLLTNDMYKRIKEQELRLQDMLEQLAKKEDRYYEMFSRMEAAIMEANAQMTYMMQQFGMYG